MLDFFYFFTDELQNPWQMLAEPQLKITVPDSSLADTYSMLVAFTVVYLVTHDSTWRLSTLSYCRQLARRGQYECQRGIDKTVAFVMELI